MFKATIGKFYDVDNNITSLRYYMSEDTKERLAIKINDDWMFTIDNDNLEIYPIVKRDNRGYIKDNIKLNQEYVISYKLVKNIDYKIYLKNIIVAKLFAPVLNYYAKYMHKDLCDSDKIEKTKKLVK
ncbi:MAG: hypothetical protein J6G98_02765 [Bacilli bacterium]|nr:hypothetical protein [Bacilli bacterium]